MKKRLIILFATVLVVLFAVFFILYLTGMIDSVCKAFFPEKEIWLNGDLSKFSKDKYTDIITADAVTEYGGSIYYISPNDKTLYRYNEQGDDEQVCASQMKYMLISDGSVYFTEAQALFVQPLVGGDVKEISKLGNDSGEILMSGGRLFFLNENSRLCSYDTGTEKSKILSSRKAYLFQLYGNHIINKSDDGIYGMDFDGTDQELIARVSGNFAVEDDYMFIVTDCSGTDFDYSLFKIDLKNNILTQLTYDTAVKPIGFQIINSKLYYYENGSYTQADMNGENVRKVENLWGADSLGTDYCLIIRDNDNSRITVYNKNDEQINEFFLEGFSVSEVVSAGGYIAVIGEEDTGLLIFDRDFNKIDAIK